MQMASSSLLSLSVLILAVLFSISSAYTGKWSLPNGINQNPIRMTVFEDHLKHNSMEAKNNQESQNVTVGPWGGSSIIGLAFDDGLYTGIREINLFYNSSSAIAGIQVNYDLNGELIEGANHTSTLAEDLTSAKIILDFPVEQIVEVSGYTEIVILVPVIRSLTFKTNINRTYGPYGHTSGRTFNLPIKSGSIIGFIGGVGVFLENIGFHLAP